MDKNAMRGPIALLSMLAPLAGQATIVVQGGGQALQAAINAANTGDILDVWSGLYSGIAVNKGLTIRCRAGVSIASAPPVVAVTVAALPAFTTLVLDGGSFNDFDISNCAGAVVFDRTSLPSSGSQRISSCGGPVVFQGMTIPAYPLGHNNYLSISNASNVSFTNCTCVPHMAVSNSNVSLTDCNVLSRGGMLAPAIFVQSGSVVVAGGNFIAGSLQFFLAAPGMQIDAGTLTVTGGAVVRSNADGAPGLNGPPGPAILTRGGSIRLDPSVRLVSPSFSPSITGPGTVVGLTIPSLSFTRPSAGTFSLTIRGEPGSLTLTAFDLPRPVVPTPSGDLWVDPRSAILDQAVLPPTGTRVVAGSLPPLPPFLTLAVQSVSLPPAGGIVLGAPVRVVFD